MPAGPSGRPTSVELTTSWASAPTAAPVWPPTIIPPMLRIIWPSPPSAPSPPVSADIADRISGGSSPASSSGSSASIPPMASTARAAIGSHSFDQTGSVASTHSERLHACTMRIPVGRVVASSSHRSAVRIASMTLRRSIVQDARVALGGDGLPRHVLGQIPVDRAALPGHQVGELAQCIGKLLRVAQRP